MTERLIVHAWKACVPKGTGGSNPPPSVSLFERARQVKSITVPNNKYIDIRQYPPTCTDAGFRVADEIEMLERLKNSGAISSEEYAYALVRYNSGGRADRRGGPACGLVW